MSKLFEQKWQAIKDTLLDGLSDSKKAVLDVVLENTRREATAYSGGLFENASAGATSAGNIAALNKTILPVLRRVMPGVIANELIGVQPMTGPFAQIHTLRVRYAQTAAGALAGSEAMAPAHVNALAAAYSGNENASNPGAGPTAALEGVPGNAINVEIVKEVVRAQTRRLSARWTLEAAADAKSQQGIDIEAEIMAALAQEITVEIDQEILRKLRALPPAATAANTFDQALVSGQATFVGDEFAALAILINRESNQIATRTRRGAANWLVVSPTALTILQSARTSAFARTTEGSLDAPTNIKQVGTLNSTMKVYCDTYAGDATPVLLGYKGPSEMDAAAFYCPYVPLTSTGTLIDPQTMEPVVGFMTRYGWLEFTNTATSFGNSPDYLGLVGINNSTLTFF
jgi:hypothetical protein